jgi:hypothetical protein
MTAVAVYWGQLLDTQVAALPPLVLMQWWLRLGWGMVLAALAVAGVGWVAGRRGQAIGRNGLRALALAVFVWCCWPGEVSPAYWLGLAFQAPSLGLGAIAGLVLLRHGLAADRWAQCAADMLGQARQWAALAALMGWILLLDSFALLPLAIYPLGFGVGAGVLLLGLVLAPWAWWGGRAHGHPTALLWVGVLLVFGLLRLPTGNVWDAVLDPWLWLWAHFTLVPKIFNCYKNRSFFCRCGER